MSIEKARTHLQNYRMPAEIDAIEALAREAARSEIARASAGGGAFCCDCGLAYDDPGFCDLVVSNETWKAISPTGHEGGLLCPTCMCRAARRAGIENVVATFRSGPFTPAQPASAGGEDTACDNCDGTGALSGGRHSIPCHVCRGTGHAPAQPAPAAEGGGDLAALVAWVTDANRHDEVPVSPAQPAPAAEGGGVGAMFNDSAPEQALDRLWRGNAKYPRADAVFVRNALRAAIARIRELEAGDEQRVRDLTKWIERAEAAGSSLAALRDRVGEALKVFDDYSLTQSERLVGINRHLRALLADPAPRVDDQPARGDDSPGPAICFECGCRLVGTVCPLCNPAPPPDMTAVVKALEDVNKIVSEAALVGFNYKDGDWAERLFASQWGTSQALKFLSSGAPTNV